MQVGLAQYIERRLRTQCGISVADYHVLVHLSEAPDGRLRAWVLGKAMRWEKSRLSQHLTRMETRDLVNRERCPTDQRGAVAVITDQGRELVDTAARLHVADVRDALIDQLTLAQLDTLCEIGDLVLRRLAETPPSP